MSSLLERGNRAVDERLGAGTSERFTRRVEPRRKGGLVWSLETDDGPRWLELEDGALRDVRPHEDRLLPLSAVLDRPGDEPAQVLSWRPGRRVVVGVQRDGRPLVVKGYRAGRSHDAARNHEHVARGASAYGLRTAELVEHDEERASLAFERLAGREPALGRGAARTFFRFGDALRRFQRMPVPADLPRHDRAREREVLDRLERRVVDLSGALPPGYERLRAALDGSVPLDAGEVLLHGDLHDRQLLQDGEELAWIDFDSLMAGEPALDVANLTAHLTLRGLQGVRGASHATVDAAAGALLDGYDAPAEPAFVESLRFHQATTFMRLALLYALRPRWLRLSPVLLTIAGRCLDDARRDR